ncbi:DNA-binding winged helix-turn-helix (wHTH) protein [Variovorax paradoxus]|uniref:DNA-binding winged helix-turn-helix (WHTH) protein n=1 Tax=Variovorax paradoxus TaxID=34073 RepID=A0AAE3Y389_VARPD|nr:winged helix-turn-helix domain-containing protein [Variovorax paradoxus]MDP9965442.1 DNA-binding winged helix-turn-helix (wHTH) protein [Variovorax paradoxus]MDR6428700.1 DNA-binding winged helix-turn-helix (wHTH) protein [Variovorax paradoxus]
MYERQPPANEQDLPAPASSRDRAGVAAAVQFADFQFDFERGQLRQGGTLIPLSPKPDALLRFFLAHPQRLISKTELMDSLWPDVVVTHDSLVHCIGELRSRLGDHGATLIATSPRRGYMFDAEVLPVKFDRAEPPARRPEAAAAPVQRNGWLAVAAPLCVSAVGIAVAIYMASAPRRARRAPQPAKAASGKPRASGS